MLRFTALAFAVVAAFAVMEWRGINMLPTTEHTRIPASVRSSPGGYRTYHTYHGFHGGK
jgi:hypothetical protein